MKKILLLSIILCACTISLAVAQKKNLVAGQNAHYEVKISTSQGNIELKLHNETPIHRDNFVKLAQENFFDNIIFHRVIKQFMIQAGDPSSKSPSAIATYGDQDSGYLLPAEINPKFFHKKGVLAAARTPDYENPERKSSGSQFYIVVGRVHNDSTLNKAKDIITKSKGFEITPDKEKIYKTIGGAPHLDGSYTIFGEVISGIKIVEKISLTKTSPLDRPLEDIFIKKIDVKLVADK